MKTMFFIILCSVAVFAITGFSNAELLGQGDLMGKKAPPIDLMNLSGDTFSLSPLRGKVILVQFWASWYPRYVNDLSSLEKLNQACKNKGLVVVAVSTDEKKEAVQKIVKENNLNFTVALDKNREVKSRYGVFALPTTFLINKKGNIVKQYIGEKDWMSQDSTDIIEKILHEE
jgi:peroxiredoxin